MVGRITLLLSVIGGSLFSSCDSYIGISAGNINNNVFYCGVENPLMLTGKNVQKADVKISCGEIVLVNTAIDTVVYCISPCNERTTTVTARIGNKTHEYLFRNKHIPNPFMVPAFPSSAGVAKPSLNSFSTFVSAESFKNFMGIRCDFFDFDYGCRSRVLDYDFTRIRVNETDKTWRIDTLNNLSSRFPIEIRYYAEQGDVYRISNCNVEISSIPYKLPLASEIRTLQDYLIVIE